eukprot:4369734-Pyramimonas_sp.AAC.1
MYYEKRGVRKELYEGPSGNLVDGLPPVPSLKPSALKELSVNNTNSFAILDRAAGPVQSSRFNRRRE